LIPTSALRGVTANASAFVEEALMAGLYWGSEDRQRGSFGRDFSSTHCGKVHLSGTNGDPFSMRLLIIDSFDPLLYHLAKEVHGTGSLELCNVPQSLRLIK
jgi:hypothetical protein